MTGEIIAGAIANQSDDVVGLSNMFGPQGQGLRVWSGAVAAALEAFPGRPLVGYDSGSDLAGAQSVGFVAVGPLKVWIYDH